MFMVLSNLDYRLNTFDNLIFNNLRTNSIVLFIIWLLLGLLLLFFYLNHRQSSNHQYLPRAGDVNAQYWLTSGSPSEWFSSSSSLFILSWSWSDVQRTWSTTIFPDLPRYFYVKRKSHARYLRMEDLLHLLQLCYVLSKVISLTILLWDDATSSKLVFDGLLFSVSPSEG
jgi:hypothetical protein